MESLPISPFWVDSCTSGSPQKRQKQASGLFSLPQLLQVMVLYYYSELFLFFDAFISCSKETEFSLDEEAGVAVAGVAVLGTGAD